MQNTKSANFIYLLNLALFLLNQVYDLVELGCEQVQTSEDCSVGAQLVRLHHLFVLEGRQKVCGYVY